MQCWRTRRHGPGAPAVAGVAQSPSALWCNGGQHPTSTCATGRGWPLNPRSKVILTGTNCRLVLLEGSMSDNWRGRTEDRAHRSRPESSQHVTFFPVLEIYWYWTFGKESKRPQTGRPPTTFEVISEDFVRNVVRSLGSSPKVVGSVASEWHLGLGWVDVMVAFLRVTYYVNTYACGRATAASDERLLVCI